MGSVQIAATHSSNRARAACRGHVDDVVDVAWSPDGSGVASASIENTVIVWDVAKCKRKVRMPTACAIVRLPSSPVLVSVRLGLPCVRTLWCMLQSLDAGAAHAEDIHWAPPLRARRGVGPAR